MKVAPNSDVRAALWSQCVTSWTRDLSTASVYIPPSSLHARAACKVDFGLKPFSFESKHTKKELRQASEMESENERESGTVASNDSDTVCRCGR